MRKDAIEIQNKIFNIYAEQTVLVSLMEYPETFSEIEGEINIEYFYLKEHKDIFEAIEFLHKRKKLISVSYIKQYLQDRSLYSEQVFLNLTIQEPLIFLDNHLKELKERRLIRELLHLSQTIEWKLLDDEKKEDIETITSFIEKTVFNLSIGQGSKEFKDSPQIMLDTREYLQKLKERGDKELIGVDTGFRDLNKMTTGFNSGDLIIIAARPAMGKCLSHGTTVLLYDGSLKKVEDVKENDLLMGDDSTPRKVLSIARGKEKMYWIRQNKGIDYRVNESHILSLKRSRNEGKYKHGDVLNITVKEYIQKSNKFKTNYKGYKVGVEFEPKPFSIDPYFLGIWLGDGNSDSAKITNTDEEIKNYLFEFGKQNNINVTVGILNKNPKHTRFMLHKDKNNNKSILQKQLLELNLIKNKHIPQNYLTNTAEIRLQLLAGLIDSDGHYGKDSKVYEITQKDENLSKQIKFLCDSLGFRTSLIPKKASIKATGFETTVYRVRFSGDIDKIPVKIARKKAEPWTINRSWQQTGITIEEDIVDDYYGFTLDGNSLFLLEDMTVTHNTSFALNIVDSVLKSGDGVAFFSLEMPSEQLAIRLLSIKTNIPLQSIRTGNMTPDEWKRLEHAMEQYEKLPLFVDDNGNANINSVRSKLRKLKSKHHNIQLAVIDYLQIMGSVNPRDRHIEVSDISRGLKLLARELNIPIIALSQLNRSLESRNDKRPILSDIRESGAIEQDADIILFVYRDDIYRLKEEKEKEKEAKKQGQKYTTNYQEKEEEDAEIIIGKQRNGPTGVVKLIFQKRYTRFVSADTHEPNFIQPSISTNNFINPNFIQEQNSQNSAKNDPNAPDVPFI